MKMNKKTKRFIETTLPMIILYGGANIIMSKFIGVWAGILSILFYAIVDVLMS